MNESDFNVCPAGTCRREDDIQYYRQLATYWKMIAVSLAEKVRDSVNDSAEYGPDIDGDAYALLSQDQSERRTW